MTSLQSRLHLLKQSTVMANRLSQTLTCRHWKLSSLMCQRHRRLSICPLRYEPVGLRSILASRIIGSIPSFMSQSRSEGCPAKGFLRADRAGPKGAGTGAAVMLLILNRISLSVASNKTLQIFRMPMMILK